MQELICSSSTRMLVTSTRSFEKAASSNQEVCDMLFVSQNYQSLTPSDDEVKLIRQSITACYADGTEAEIPKERVGKMQARVSLAVADYSGNPNFNPERDLEAYFSDVGSLDRWLVPIDIVNKAAAKEKFQASSLDDKNFVDSLILGETVHSWIKGRTGNVINLTRYTTSNLPITNVTINYVEMKVDLGIFFRPIEVGKLRWEYLPVIFNQTMEPKVINLTLVKTGNSSRNRKESGEKSQDGVGPSKDRGDENSKELD